MEIIDYSPKYENKDNVKQTLYKFNNKEEFSKIYNTLKAQGFNFVVDRGEEQLWAYREKYFKRLRFIECSFNSINGKKEMIFTSLTILKSYPQYKGINLRKRIATI